MGVDWFDRFRVIDDDTHLAGPLDLRTSRVAAKWGAPQGHTLQRVLHGNPASLCGLS